MSEQDDRPCGRVLMEVIGVRRGCSDVPPLLVLSEIQGTGVFLTPLGPDHAHLLAHELGGHSTPLALTYDLVDQLAAWLGTQVTSIRLMDERNRGEVAEIELEAHHDRKVVRAGVADAAVLSRRLGVPVSVPRGLVSEMGPDDNHAAVVDDFRRFLDRASPDDFSR
ncbi:MAG: bifunctional nuclease family protein [Actinobacteria bacterium]|nr:bifunctional nuclease family protein [Actinomycetota bacterium]